jgi:cation diffusion facilitator CzcD-associated flavoprotein CzcO
MITKLIYSRRSSGIQILPSIQPRVGHLTTFIREPTWVSPVQGLEQHVYSPEELDDFVKVPGTLLNYRKQNETNLDTITNIFARDGAAQKETRALMTQQMKDKLKNDKLASQLIPQWGVGCRRLTPGVNYLETLSAPNVTVVYGEINLITEKGCICDDGREYAVDVLVCATGFDTSFKPRFPVVGLKRVDLRDQWASEPKGYLGIAVSNMPNYFQFLGPNCPVGNGPLLSAIGKFSLWQ